jgi:hypothetical protein
MNLNNAWKENDANEGGSAGGSELQKNAGKTSAPDLAINMVDSESHIIRR